MSAIESGQGVTVCIPTRNEEMTIGRMIEGVRPYADEIMVVDGHSTDNTRRISEEKGARFIVDNGKGKGAALRLALEEARGRYIVFIDADGSHDPTDIPRLLEPLQRGEADMVVGSRPKGGSDELHGDIEKFARMIGSDIITLGINYRFGVRLSDSQNGFRAMTVECGRALGLTEDITTIEQEMIMKALHRGFRIQEVPAHEYKREYGESTIVVSRVAFRYVYSLVKGLIFRD